jgi:lactate racemase
MEIMVPYGKDKVAVVLDDSRVAGIIHPNPVKNGNEEDTLKKALANPLNSLTFSDFMSGDAQTLFIVNDGTRPTPTSKVLDVLAEDLKGKNCDFIIATGVHRAPTDEEYRFIFGKHFDELNKNNRIFVHDAKNDKEMLFIGTSTNGTEMWVNKKVMEAERIVIIGSVEPHYFAGYTGGRKAILPGLASYKTITMNHKFALKPEAKALALKGNPVHEDMIDALKTLKDKDIFSIQTVLNKKKKIYAATAGHIVDSMDAAIESAKSVFAVNVEKKEDIVVSVAPYPMDVDLYQSQKAIEHGKLALNDGGIIIMISQCRTGIGPDAFYQLMAGCNSPEEVVSKISRRYKLGYHKAAKMVEIGLWAEIWAVSWLDPEMMKKIFIRPFSDIQEAINEALKLKGPDAKVLFLMEGSVTVPNITG